MQPADGEFEGALVADLALHEPCAAIAGNDAEVEEGFAEYGALGGDAQVGHVGEVEAGADGGTIDRGDDGHFDLLQRQRDALDALPVARGDLGDIPGEIAAAFGHVLDVAT